MAIYTYECPDCQGEVMVGFSDRVLDTELIWSASHKCDRCNYRVEDDFGRLPDCLRNLLLD